MAGKSRGLVERDGRFYARIVVPAALRPIVGKAELRVPLGPDRRTATRKLAGALARFHAQIEQAQRELDARAPTPSEGALLRSIYADELRLDAAERDLRHLAIGGEVIDFDAIQIDRGRARELFVPARKRALLRVAAGDAENDRSSGASRMAH